MRERLNALYDGGLVVPLPFFKAELAQPLALLRAPQPAATAATTTTAQGPLLPEVVSRPSHQPSQSVAAGGLSERGVSGTMNRRVQEMQGSVNGGVAGVGSLGRNIASGGMKAQPQLVAQQTQHQLQQQALPPSQQQLHFSQQQQQASAGELQESTGRGKALSGIITMQEFIRQENIFPCRFCYAQFILMCTSLHRAV